MTWNELGNVTIAPDWRLTPVIPLDAGFFRLKFSSLGTSAILIAQCSDSLAEGISEVIKITPTSVSQVVILPCPGYITGNRRLAFRLASNVRSISATLEVSDTPVGSSSVNLSPVTNALSLLSTELQSVASDLATVKNNTSTLVGPGDMYNWAEEGFSYLTLLYELLTALQTKIENTNTLVTGFNQVSFGALATLIDSGKNAILQAIQSLNVSVDPAILTGIQAIQSAQTSQGTTLSSITTQVNKIDGVVTTQASQGQTLSAIQTTQGSHTTSLANLATSQTNQDSALNTIQTSLNSILNLLTVPSTAAFNLLATPYTATSSSKFSNTADPSYANFNDNSGTTGAATGQSATEWIKATFATAQVVKGVRLGAGSVSGYGGVASILNGAAFQYSTDDSAWTTLFTVSGITASGDNQFVLFSFPSTTARYFRLFKSGGTGVTEMRFFA